MRTVLLLALSTVLMGGSVFGQETPTQEQQVKIDQLVEEIRKLKPGLESAKAVAKEIVMMPAPTGGYEAFEIKTKGVEGSKVPEASNLKWGPFSLEGDGKIGFVGDRLSGCVALMPPKSSTIKIDSNKTSVLFFNYNPDTKTYGVGLKTPQGKGEEGKWSFTRAKSERWGFAYIYVPK